MLRTRSLSTAGGSVKWYLHSRRHFGSFVTHETYSYHMTQEVLLLSFLLENEIFCLYKSLYLPICTSFIYCSQILEILAHPSVCESYKPWYSPYHGILCNSEEEGTIDECSRSLDGYQGHCAEWKVVLMLFLESQSGRAGWKTDWWLLGVRDTERRGTVHCKGLA